jgi:hypothetical protein
MMRGRYPDGYWIGGPPFWMELLGWLLFVLLLAAVVGLVVWAALRLGGRRGQAAFRGPGGPWPPEWSRPGPDAALQAVRLRYAQGEITREDYLRLVADLGGQVPGPPGAPAAPPPGAPPSRPPGPAQEGV